MAVSNSIRRHLKPQIKLSTFTAFLITRSETPHLLESQFRLCLYLIKTHEKAPLINGARLYSSLLHSGLVCHQSVISCFYNGTDNPPLVGWFTGLSELFLSSRSARLLVLAGTDRLDKTLMIGQMQGKFQMEVLPDVGHMLQEVSLPIQSIIILS